MRLPQALITELIPEEFLWGVDSTGFSLTIMWHFFTFRDIIYFEFFRGRPLVTRKNSNYFITNSTWMFSKMDNSPSPDSEKLTFWCPRPSFFEFWVFFAHTSAGWPLEFFQIIIWSKKNRPPIWKDIFSAFWWSINYIPLCMSCFIALIQTHQSWVNESFAFENWPFRLGIF